MTLARVSRAPYDKLAAYQRRVSWSFPWYSSAPGDFDFHVSFTADQQRQGGEYNFARQPQLPEEAPGLSAFALGEYGRIFHTYSTCPRDTVPGIRAEAQRARLHLRIHRDTRFSDDRRTYKDVDLWFWEEDRKAAVSGLFLRIAPDAVAAGAGHASAGSWPASDGPGRRRGVPADAAGRAR